MTHAKALQEALSYLQERSPAGVRFGLGTVRAVVESLHHPERAYPVLLIAGTNGKGSVVAYLDAALRANGYCVGRYTSPHLVRIQERIVVDGAEIGDVAFADAVHEVRDASQTLVSRREIADHPTFFEVLTAAALLEFRRRRVSVALLEVGMGARLDATNVSEPLCSAIVSVALDHERFLGDTLEAIAAEKAGVLRAGRVTVLGPLPHEAHASVRKRAHELGARLVSALEDVVIHEDGDRLDVRTSRRLYHDLKPLPGAYQRTNLVVALRLLESAADAGLASDPTRVESGLRHVEWPGRLELFATAPPTLLDGAHNPAAATALADEVSRRGPFVLLFGVMRDKNVEGISRALFPLARRIVLTRPRIQRAATPEEIASRAGELAVDAVHEADSRRAFEIAQSLAAPDEFVLVTGSLYLVGEVRSMLAPAAEP